MIDKNEKNRFRLARYLLNYAEEDMAAPEEDKDSLAISAYPYYSDAQIITEVENILHKIKPHTHSVFTVYQDYLQHHAEHSQHLLQQREDKAELLETYHVYDKNILLLVKNFLIMAIALLVELERLHKKNHLHGNVNPYTFIYSKTMRTCEPYPPDSMLDDKKTVTTEKLAFGAYIYVTADLATISFTKYLAPELRDAVRVYRLQRRLSELLIEMEARKIHIKQKQEIMLFVHEYHQKKLKITNRAEIYSAGYTLNQILSHMLTKLIHFNMLPNEFPKFPVQPSIIYEAELLLPHKYANPEEELVVGLLNEAIEYTHDLMHEKMEKRDSLELAIEKFSSLLKRTSITKPDSLLEAEEEHMEKAENDRSQLEKELEENETAEYEAAENEAEELAEEEQEAAEEAEEMEYEEAEYEEDDEELENEKEEQELAEEESESEEEGIEADEEIEDGEELEHEAEEAEELENEEEQEAEEAEEEHEIEANDKEDAENQEQEETEHHGAEHEHTEQHAQHDEHDEPHKQHGHDEHNDSQDLEHDEDKPAPHSGFRPGH